MKITFWGVRGSIASPGPLTQKYGGNTSCVQIETESGHDIVLDSGTGIRHLGKVLATRPSPINILLSHSHWDHVQGYPFFEPNYQPDREINIFSHPVETENRRCPLRDQLDGFHFPLVAEDVTSKSVYHYENVAEHFASHCGVVLKRKPLNHPGSGSAFLLEENGVSCAYVTDNELDPPYAQSTTWDQWVDYLHRVDVLIHDAQYTEDDMPHKHGWGHSLITQVRQLASDAEVGALVMFHHDPDRTDSEIDEIQRTNEKILKDNCKYSKSICAAEGMQISLSKPILGGDTKIELL